MAGADVRRVAGAGFIPALLLARAGKRRAGVNPAPTKAGPPRPPKHLAPLALALLLALWLALPPAARAQAVDPKTAVTNFIKAGLIDPSSYEGIDWSQPVKMDPNGPYTQAIRHTYRLRDPMYGRVSFDDIFFLDPDGHVMGSTSTTRWKSRRWGAGREKW